jgi:hypothetical protein
MGQHMEKMVVGLVLAFPVLFNGFVVEVGLHNGETEIYLLSDLISRSYFFLL